MKLSRLFLGLVLSSGLAIIVSACGSSDSDNNGNSPFGGGGSSGTSTGGGSVGGSGSISTYSSGSWICANAPVSCKAGTIAACCNSSGTQCKYVVGGKDYPCDGDDCESTAETVASLCY